LRDAAASIFVITADDIRRPGVSSLPEALRLAPNLQVARVSANSYAISARGFNNAIGNKLLVLIDGRTVYTPLFSGVFWDSQDVMLEDVERIEVISGPGATLWGANAVNGVINVITRPAADTQGALLAAGGGNQTKGGAARYGGEMSSGGHYRVYGQYFDRANTEHANGTSVFDDWNSGRIGFRADWGGAARGFTLQGDAYRGELDQAAPGTQRISGVNLLARWNRQLSEDSSVRVQAYYDRANASARFVCGTRDIFDLEFQHALRPAASHRLLWGGGYRYAFGRVDNSAALAFLPPIAICAGDVFVQDDRARINLDRRSASKPKAMSTPASIGCRARAPRVEGSRQSPAMGSVSRRAAFASRLTIFTSQPAVLLAGGPSSSRSFKDVRARLSLAADEHDIVFDHRVPSQLRPPAQPGTCAGRRYRSTTRSMAPATASAGHLSGYASVAAECRAARIAAAARVETGQPFRKALPQKATIRSPMDAARRSTLARVRGSGHARHVSARSPWFPLTCVRRASGWRERLQVIADRTEPVRTGAHRVRQSGHASLVGAACFEALAHVSAESRRCFR
jgi:hypothetical protein